MIHDAEVEVTCDSDRCRKSVHVALEYVYSNFSEGGGHYDDNDSKVEIAIEKDEGWTVDEGSTDRHRHFCELCSEDL